MYYYYYYYYYISVFLLQNHSKNLPKINIFDANFDFYSWEILHFSSLGDLITFGFIDRNECLISDQSFYFSHHPSKIVCVLAWLDVALKVTIEIVVKQGL